MEALPPRRYLDWKMNKVFYELSAAWAYLAKEGALGEANRALSTFDGFQGEVSNFLIWTLPSPTQLFALIFFSKIYDDMIMVSNGHSIALEQKMILPHIRNNFEYDKRLLTLLHAWAKLWNFLRKDTFQKEVDFHVLQSCLEQDQLQER